MIQIENFMALKANVAGGRDGETCEACADPGAAAISLCYTRKGSPAFRLGPAPTSEYRAHRMLELPTAGAYCPQLPPTSAAAGKRITSYGESRPSEGVRLISKWLLFLPFHL